MAGSGQFGLLIERRFLPYLLTQSLGAFNDSLLRNLVLLAATYQAARRATIDPTLAPALAGALFVLPFVFLSGLAGQLADHFDRALIVRLVKAAQLAIVALAAWGFLAHSVAVLLVSLALTGVQATFFAPAKYALLRQVLRDGELVGGNAVVEAGSVLAMLVGIAGAGFLTGRDRAEEMAGVLAAVALLALLASLLIPRVAAVAPRLRLDWNLWASTWKNVSLARESRPVFLSLLGVSWFWFYGFLLLTQLPAYAHLVRLGADEVVVLMLGVFAGAVALGALLCGYLSGDKVEIGLVPFGSIGLTLFAADLAWAWPADAALLGVPVRAFVAQPHAWRMLIDLAGIGLSGGLYVVPLHALVQQRARRAVLARVMAANSLLNALFVVAAGAFAAGALALGANLPALILMTALLNALVALYIYSLVPEFLLRLISWLLIHTVYRIDERGLDNIPEEGAALLVCNHVSFVDGLVISAASRRPIRFVMESAIFRTPVISVLARGMKAVPIAPSREDPKVYEEAFATVAHELRAGELVCIFPEGRLTTDGAIGEFRPGLMRILAETPVPVVPLALTGLWGSVFSRAPGRLLTLLMKSISRRIGIAAGPAVQVAEVTPELLRDRVVGLVARATRLQPIA